MSISETPAAWLMSHNIEKTMFTAYPTYVDYDAIIYMHESSDHELLAQMRNKIMKAYGGKPIPNELKVVYSPGQACIAQYHLDHHFYRGIIQEVKPNGEYEVLFIDYGNVETMKYNELRPYTPFPNLKARAAKYSLDGICPRNGAKRHDTTVLDAIHKIIVDKLVLVRVLNMEPHKSCSIRIGSDDLAGLLIEQGFAERDMSLPAIPVASLSAAEYALQNMSNQSNNCNEDMHLMSQAFSDDFIIDSSSNDKSISKVSDTLFAALERNAGYKNDKKVSYCLKIIEKKK